MHVCYNFKNLRVAIVLLFQLIVWRNAVTNIEGSIDLLEQKQRNDEKDNNKMIIGRFWNIGDRYMGVGFKFHFAAFDVDF